MTYMNTNPLIRCYHFRVPFLVLLGEKIHCVLKHYINSTLKNNGVEAIYTQKFTNNHEETASNTLKNLGIFLTSVILVFIYYYSTY